MRIAALLRGLVRPHYVFHPSQVVRRIAWRFRRRGVDRVTATLPWGMSIRCFSDDAIGLSIQQLGVLDLSVAEVLWRLTEPGELTLDVGANVGQMTGLLALCAGANGRVISFEPNPDVGAELAFNVNMWRERPDLAPIDVSLAALSDHDGDGHLLVPAYYEWNRGTAQVVLPGELQHGPHRRIQLARLDSFVPSPLYVGVIKLDVEGHEAAVLRGGSTLLSEHRVRDVVYEDHVRYPTAASEILEAHGYTIFAVGATFWGPCLGPASGPPIVADWESPSFLATLDPHRARERLRSRGWRVL